MKNFFYSGDSAFALNDTIITPYSRDAAANDIRMAIFNIR